ncbi:MAG: sugar phosphate isomerase/epimerase [Gemmataceae bacterium]|nr:sugar phosphate isomerase/epimerase [Gemmataceae bacterium]
MFILSAFADEISPDPREQIAVLQKCRIRFIEFRSVYNTNCLALNDAQVREFKKMLDDAGIGVSAIGSPIGKVPIDASFEEHMRRFERALELCSLLGTRNIRIFSFYPPGNDPQFDPTHWPQHRQEVVHRLTVITQRAAQAGVTLFHENEHRIYGDSPQRVVDLLRTVNHSALRAAYDAANYAYCGYDPVEAWEMTKEYTAHFHIKDWKKGGHAAGHAYGLLAGYGDGNIAHSIRDAVQRNYHGFAVLEPHLRGGGPTGGVTGPDLFPCAVEAFRSILRDCGGQEG